MRSFLPKSTTGHMPERGKAVANGKSLQALLVVSTILVFAVSAHAAEKSGPGDEPGSTSAPATTSPAVKSEVNPNEAAIQATADAFAKAFNAGNAKDVADLWTANGSLIDERGAVFKGRKAIEDLYAAFFKEYPGARIEILVGSIEFPTPTTAVEDGISRVVLKDANSGGTSRYSAVHVLEDGKWRMASVRETSLTPPAGYARTKNLEWLVGEWENTSETATVRNSIRWIANKCYLQRDYTVSEDGKTTSSGTQIIGWDPRLDQMRSWSFDSSGGHGTGLWTPTPEGWRIESTGTLANGTPTSSLDYVIHIPGDDGVFGWRSMDRKVGMVRLPDTREVILDRVHQKQ